MLCTGWPRARRRRLAGSSSGNRRRKKEPVVAEPPEEETSRHPPRPTSSCAVQHCTTTGAANHITKPPVQAAKTYMAAAGGAAELEPVRRTPRGVCLPQLSGAGQHPDVAGAPGRLPQADADRPATPAVGSHHRRGHTASNTVGSGTGGGQISTAVGRVRPLAVGPGIGPPLLGKIYF